MTTLLVLAAGRRNYVVEALLEAAAPTDTLLVADRSPFAAALSVSGTYPLLEPSNGDETGEWLIATCRNRSVDAVICLHDYRTVEIARIQEKLRAHGTRFIGPSEETAKLLLDKFSFAGHVVSVCEEASVPTLYPGQLTSRHFDEHPTWVLKDRYGSGSSGLADLDSFQSVQSHLSNAETIICQPKFSSPEWNVDLFYDESHVLRGYAAKIKRRMRAGETDAATVVTRAPKGLIETCEQVLSGLRVSGNVDMDLFAEADGFKLIDVNPRFGGGYAFSSAAGYDAASAVWAMAGNAEIADLRVAREFTGSKSMRVVELRQTQDVG